MDVLVEATLHHIYHPTTYDTSPESGVHMLPRESSSTMNLGTKTSSMRVTLFARLEHGLRSPSRYRIRETEVKE